MTVAASSDAGSTALGLVLIVLGIAAYWVPTVVAGIRRVPNLGSVIVLNFFLGWTVVGWVIALAMAARSRPPGYAPPPAPPGLEPWRRPPPRQPGQEP